MHFSGSRLKPLLAIVALLWWQAAAQNLTEVLDDTTNTTALPEDDTGALDLNGTAPETEVDGTAPVTSGTQVNGTAPETSDTEVNGTAPETNETEGNGTAPEIEGNGTAPETNETEGNGTAPEIEGNGTAPEIEGNGTAPETPEKNETERTPPEKSPCYNNISVLVEHMDYKNPFTPETYILCPNTIFPIGSETTPGERCCLDNQSPLLSRSNTEIKCGDDGDPKNKCVLTGGIFQLLFSYTNWAEMDENFVVEGVTFQEADFASVMLSNGGDVTFRNCVFRNHSGIGPVLSYYIPLEDTRRKRHRSLIDSAMQDMDIHQRVGYAMNEYTKLFRGEGSIFEVEEDTNLRGENDERSLQKDIQTQTHLWDGTVFSENKQGSRGGQEKFGVITVEKNFDVMEMKDCVFENNLYGDPLKKRGYAISLAAGTTLSIAKTCLLGNNFIGEGAVMIGDEASLLNATGNFGTPDDGLTCEFIQVMNEVNETKCVDYDSDKCLSRLNPPVPQANQTNQTNQEPENKPEKPKSGSKSTSSKVLPFSMMTALSVFISTLCFYMS